MILPAAYLTTQQLEDAEDLARNDRANTITSCFMLDMIDEIRSRRATPALDHTEIRALLTEYRSELLGRAPLRMNHLAESLQYCSLLARIQKVLDSLPPPTEETELDKQMSHPAVKAGLEAMANPTTSKADTGPAQELRKKRIEYIYRRILLDTTLPWAESEMEISLNAAIQAIDYFDKNLSSIATGK